MPSQMWSCRMSLIRGFMIAVVSLLLIKTALGEGSIGFDEVMKFAAHNPTLVKDIQTAIRHQHVKRSNILCGGARFGNQWTNLGGERAPPFTCRVGKLLLTING